jgi:hypothetical protein
MKKFLNEGDTVFATGVYLTWDGEKWVVGEFEDDTFYNGIIVEDVEDNPYVEM